LEEDETSRVFTLLDLAARTAETKQDEATACTAEQSYRKYALIDDSGLPKEFVRLMDTYTNGQMFFSNTSHPWILKPPADLTPRQVWSSNFSIDSPAVHFMDLSDGRGIAYASFAQSQHERPSCWLMVGKPDGQQFESVAIIAKDFLPFLQRLIEAEGRYYFDDPHFQPEIVF
jgi:hypothetical protein